MNTQSKYTLANLYRIMQFKGETQDIQEQLSKIDSEIERREQDNVNLSQNKTNNPFQEWLNQNADSKTEPVEEDKEKLWSNYILVILLVFYIMVMSFL